MNPGRDDGGEGRPMSERTTGATNDQIEAAVERHWAEILEESPNATRTATYRYEIGREIGQIACYLVPPRYRIVGPGVTLFVPCTNDWHIPFVDLDNDICPVCHGLGFVPLDGATDEQ